MDKMIKFCNQCKLENEFVKSQFAIKNGKCKICQKRIREKNKELISEYNKKYYQENKNELDIHHKKYYQKNKDHLLESQKKYLKENEFARSHKKEYNKKYSKNYHNEYQKERSKNDPAFRLRQIVSRSIRAAVNRIYSKKFGSCLKYLSYSIQELKNHIEKQFEPWMTWNNQGSYNCKTWNDNDSSTWAWQLDHIIPQSDLPYVNMKDDNFKKCWNLENLRPLSSKQNVLDGTSRIRHK